MPIAIGKKEGKVFRCAIVTVMTAGLSKRSSINNCSLLVSPCPLHSFCLDGEQNRPKKNGCSSQLLEVVL